MKRLTFLPGLLHLQAGVRGRQKLLLGHVSLDLGLGGGLVLPNVEVQVIVPFRGAESHAEGPGGSGALRSGGAG